MTGFYMMATLVFNELIHSYLSDRKQGTKTNSAYNSWEEILFRVPQDSIFGQLLFNIFIFDLFSVVTNIDFSSYAYDDTICHWEYTKKVIETLEKFIQRINRVVFK